MLFNTFTPICSPITADPTGAQTLTLKLSLPAGKFVTIDWGDGNRTKVSGGVTEQNYAHAYSGAGSFPVRFHGDFRFLTYFKITGVSVSGTTERLGALSGVTIFDCIGSNTISGNLSDLPSGVTYFYCAGSNTISGNLSDLPSGMTHFSCIGSNTISDYTSKVWTTKPSTFYFMPTGVGGLSTAEIDQLLIDFDDDLVWAAGNTITLTGTNAARSSASDAAVANMVAEGATVTTN